MRRILTATAPVLAVALAVAGLTACKPGAPAAKSPDPAPAAIVVRSLAAPPVPGDIPPPAGDTAAGLQLTQAEWDSIAGLLGLPLAPDAQRELEDAKAGLPDPLFFTATTFRDTGDVKMLAVSPLTCRLELALRMSAFLARAPEGRNAVLEGVLEGDSLLAEIAGCAEFAEGRAYSGFFHDSAAGRGIWKPIALKYRIEVGRMLRSSEGNLVPVRFHPYVGDPARDPQPLLFASSRQSMPRDSLPFGFFPAAFADSSSLDTTIETQTRTSAIAGAILPGYRGFEVRTTSTWVPGDPVQKDPETGETYGSRPGRFESSSAIIALPAAGDEPDFVVRDGQTYDAGEVGVLGIGDLDGDGEPDYWLKESSHQLLIPSRAPTQVLQARFLEPEGC